jgi:hypothetical protein
MCHHSSEMTSATSSDWTLSLYLQPNGIADTNIAVTRSHKTTDRDHAGLANGTAVPEDNLPKYFGKAGYAGESPSKTKKQGGGKSNW